MRAMVPSSNSASRRTAVGIPSSEVRLDEDKHLHHLPNHPPKVPVPVLVNTRKCVSIRRLRQMRPEIARLHWKGVLCPPSYFHCPLQRCASEHHPRLR